MLAMLSLLVPPGDDLIGWIRFASAVFGLVAAVLAVVLRVLAFRRRNKQAAKCEHDRDDDPAGSPPVAA